MRLLHLVLLGSVIVWAPSAAEAQQIALAWDANSEPNVTYLVSYGTQPRSVQPYSTTVVAGTSTQWVFAPPSPVNAYYFAVQARNADGLVSGYSTEVLLEPTGFLPAPPGSSDLNGDGRIDLIWQHETNGLLAAWFMNGTALADAAPLNPQQVSDTNWKIVGSGDFNGDGHLDLFWQHQTTRLMTIWLMNGTQFLRAGLLSNNTVSDTNWEIRAIADVNGDSWPDLVWQHATEGSLAVWILNGTRFVEGRNLTPNRVADRDWKIVGAGDFTGDSRPDLVWQNQATGVVTVWQMDGTTLTAGRPLYPAITVSDTQWKIATVLDMNGDQKPDLVWQHRKAGWINTWLMNGTTVMRMASLQPGQVGDLGWRIIGPR